jgi:hypothetical protein
MTWRERFFRHRGVQPISSTPRYIQDSVVFPPPYTCSNVLMFGFVLEGDKDRLNAFLSPMMDIPHNNIIRFTAISHYLLLTFTHMPKVVSGLPVGWMTETEVTLWILTCGMRKVGPVWTPDPTQLSFMVPYIWVDNPISIAGGREIYGFPKQWGTVQMPTTYDISNPAPIPSMSLDALAIKTFHPETQAQVQRLMDITCTADSSVDPTVWRSADDAFKGISRVMLSQQPTWKPISPLIDSLRMSFIKTVPIVFFKQFRAVGNSQDACFQAISKVAVEVDWNAFQGGLLPGQYQLSIQELASQPLDQHLGITNQTPLLQFWVQMNMTFGFGTDLFTARTLP